MLSRSYIFVQCFLILWLLPSCQKKEARVASRCIYDHTVFVEAALQAVQNEDKFSEFKRDPFLNLLWENLTREEGEVWLHTLQNQFPHIAEKWQQFRENDLLGSPRAYSYPEAGTFSPSTLRLIAIAANIQQKVGDLSSLHIIQIGAGYGGLCKILHTLSPCQSYTIVDLPPELALARKYLEKLGISHVKFLTPDELSKTAHYDLVISDQNFSEFNHSYQQLFFDRILSRCDSGYLLGRVFPKHFGIVAWNIDELKKRLEKSGTFSGWEVQEPAIDRENYYVYWKFNSRVRA